MDGPDQMAYDRGTTIFSPDGRLYQVEYAREAVERGSASVAVRTTDGVVFVVDKRVRSPLVERTSVEKLHGIDDHVGAASAGHVADGRKLVDFMRRQAQVEQRRYGERMDVEPLTERVSDVVQQYSQIGGARTFGCALLVGGVDSDGTPRLFETDPSGTFYEWAAVAVGANRETIQSALENHYEDDRSLEDGVRVALQALNAPEDASLDASTIAIATVDATAHQYERLDDATVTEYVEDLDIATDQSDDEATDTADGTDDSVDETDDTASDHPESDEDTASEGEN
jgi:proteasome alpha subunit